MATAITRHTSTVSLVSQSSVQLEAGLLVQCLNRYKEYIETGCDRILEAKYMKNNISGATLASNNNSGSYARHSGTISPCSFPCSGLENTATVSIRRLDSGARENLGQHLIQLLATIVLPDPPQSINEVDARLVDGLPGIPDKLMPTDSDMEHYRNLAEKGRKKFLHLPFDKIYAALKEFNGRFIHSVCLYIVAIAEHVIGNFLQAAICYEEKALTLEVIRASTVETLFILYRDRVRTRRKTFEHRLANLFPQDYEKCVDELDSFLHTSLEQMNLLLRVFREPLLSLNSCDQIWDNSAQLLFGSILDLYSNMRILLDTLETEDEEVYAPPIVTKQDDSSTPTADNESDLLPTDNSLRTTRSLASSISTLGGSGLNDDMPPNKLASSDKFLEHASSRLNKPNSTSRRFVGICLIEMAEDDSLHAFSDYASTILDPNARDRAWELADHEGFTQSLCRLSRTILNTASLSKLPVLPGTNFSSDFRWADSHSFLCARCHFWDSLVPKPRRRSTSSNCPTTNCDNLTSQSDGGIEVHPESTTRYHRSPHLSLTYDSSSSTQCNYLVNSFKYLLPRLILIPIFQFFYLHELIETLHRWAYDDEDRARLKEVLSMLSKTRSNLERDLAKHPWIALHLVRLISTGHLSNRYRSLYLSAITLTPCPSSPSSHTSPPSPISVSCSHTIPPSQSSSSPNLGNPSCMNLNFPPTAPYSTDPNSVVHAQLTKAEEIERLLGGKDKLLTSAQNKIALGDFVMEGRIHLRTESKRSSSEHIAYLFTGLLIICKWQERRSTSLNPSLAQNSALRVKYRIPLESIHVTDLPPMVQPNLTAYVGPLTPSVVDAAVLAAAAANTQSSSNSHGHDELSSVGFSSLFSSGWSGSVASQSSLTSAGGPGVCAYPYLFELEYIENSSSSPALTRPYYHHHHHHHPMRHSSPHKGLTDMHHPHSADSSSTLPPSSSVSMIGLSGDRAGSANTTGLPPGMHVHRIWIASRTPEEKADWISSLLSIQTHRLFLRYIRTLPKLEVALRLPSPSVYRFAQPDSPDNIIFETSLPAASSQTDDPLDLQDSLGSSEDGLDDNDDDDGDDGCLRPDSDDDNNLNEPNPSVIDSFLPLVGNATLRQETLSPSLNMLDSSTSSSKSNGNQESVPVPTESDDQSTLDSHTLTQITTPLILKSKDNFNGLNSNAKPTAPNHPPTQPILPNNFPPQIRMATLDKLIERLTYPTYFDARSVNSFLLVFRRFLTPSSFLDLLIERFRVPDPEFHPDELIADADKGQLEPPAQHILKRFRSGYKKRVQTRVLMVLSRWVRNSRYYQYDFASNPDLVQRLLEFLSSIQARHLSIACRRIEQYLKNMSNQITNHLNMVQEVEHKNPNSANSPTTSSIHPNPTSSYINFTQVHPYKVAEQVTLYEWELYRRIQFWEVEGHDRTENGAPNLNRSKMFSNRFRNWLVYAILSESNWDDRVIVIQRVIDLMLMMEQMNNLQGSQEAKSALISAAVFRLRKSFRAIRRIRHYRDVVDRLRREGTAGPKSQSSSIHPGSSSESTATSHYHGLGLPFSTRISKAHERRIRALEQQHASGDVCHPCVPFIAAGVMTKLIHLDLRHPDTIKTESGSVMINCWKHRQLAEIVERYLAFQRIPYTFTLHPEIRNFLENLDPLSMAGVSTELDFERRMYELSEIYEPRDCDSSSDNNSSSVLNSNSVEERRMSKEEIQAANLLSSSSLKERMSRQSIFSFEALLNPSKSSHKSFGYGPANMLRSTLSGHKSPKSMSPPSTPSKQFNKGAALPTDLQQQRKYLRLPNSLISGSGFMSPSAGGKHQHSMSDSQVLSPNHPGIHLTTPCHQAANSVVGVTTVQNSGLSLPSTPIGTSNSSDPSNLLQPNFYPPPLPPRQRLQSGGTLSSSPSSKINKSLPGSLSHHQTGSQQFMAPTKLPDPSNDNHANGLPPPLPPKSSSNNRSANAQHSNRTASSSPLHSNIHNFTFCTDPSLAFKLTQDLAPPLPPKKSALPNVASAVSAAATTTTASFWGITHAQKS